MFVSSKAYCIPPQKVARLVLIPKAKGDPEAPSSCRPLCMQGIAKVFEKMIRKIFKEAIVPAGDLSSQADGTRKEHSTIFARGRIPTLEVGQLDP